MDSEPQDPQPEYVSTICADCKADYQRRVFWVLGKSIGGTRCGPCQDAAAKEASRDHDALLREVSEEKWRKACPVIYRDTDSADPRLNPVAVKCVASWSPHSKRGIGLIGTTGLGKTRCLYLALRKAFDAGLTVAAISHTKLSRVAMDAYSGSTDERGEARATLRTLYTRNVLLLDDLGKPPSTDRADSELEGIIEERTNSALPILWSANGSGEWLIKRFGIDRGEPTVRRLAEFSEVPTL